jgi:hypothetical protein
MTTIIKIIGVLAIVAAISGLWMTLFTGLSGPGGKAAFGKIWHFSGFSTASLNAGNSKI